MSTPARPIHKWDDRSHIGLLLALLDVSKPSKDVITAAAEHMKEQGFQTTYHGVNQHIQKLRRDQGSPEKAAVANGDKSEPVTPRKRKAASTKKATPAKSAAAADDDHDDDHDEGDPLPPVKKEEPVTPKRAKKAKVECVILSPVSRSRLGRRMCALADHIIGSRSDGEY
ncbi:hypothetical protein E4U41_003805 [Claviceps citrina]|nr:hypothetical protein E4U41_003805 [Claviceps citrina]